MVKLFLNYAIDQGFNPKADQSEDKSTNLVLFDKDNLHFVFSCNEDRDPNYFQLSLPYIDNNYDSSNAEQVQFIMSLTRKYKTGKALVFADGHISLTFEQYVFSNTNINKLFDKAIGCLTTMIMEYREWKRTQDSTGTQS